MARTPPLLKNSTFTSIGPLLPVFSYNSASVGGQYKILTWPSASDRKFTTRLKCYGFSYDFYFNWARNTTATTLGFADFRFIFFRGNWNGAAGGLPITSLLKPGIVTNNLDLIYAPLNNSLPNNIKVYSDRRYSMQPLRVSGTHYEFRYRIHKWFKSPRTTTFLGDTDTITDVGENHYAVYIVCAIPITTLDVERGQYTENQKLWFAGEGTGNN